jgi:mRNA interferase MazF
VTVRRGEIWLVDFGDPVGREQAGHRPAVVVSDDRLHASGAGVLIVVPCTTTHRDLPTYVELDDTLTGLDAVSYAKCEDVKSISDRRLGARVGSADSESMFAIARALRFLLDL